MSELGERHPYVETEILLHRHAQGENVESEFKALVEQYPNDWNVFEGYIHHFDRKTNAEKIAEELEAAEERFDDVSQFHLMKAIVYYNDGKLCDALKESNEAALLSKTGTDVNNNAKVIYNNICAQIEEQFKEKRH